MKQNMNNKQINPQYVIPEHHIDYCWLSADFLSSILGGTIHSGKSNIEHFEKYIKQIVSTADQIELLTLGLMRGVKANVRITEKRAEYIRYSNSIKQLVENTRGVMKALGVIKDEVEVRKTADLILANKHVEAVEHTKTLLIEGGIYTAISLVFDSYLDVHKSADLLFNFTDELVKESQIESASIAYMAMFKLILQNDQIYSSLTMRLAKAVKYAIEQLEFVTLQEEQHRKIQATFLFLKKMIPLGVTKVIWGHEASGKHLQYVWCIQNKFNGDFLYPVEDSEAHSVQVSYPETETHLKKFEIIAAHDDKFYIQNTHNKEYLSVTYLFDEKTKPRRSMYTTAHQSVASFWSFEPVNFDEFYLKSERKDETIYLVGPQTDSHTVYAYRGKNPTKLTQDLKPSQLYWILNKCY